MGRQPVPISGGSATPAHPPLDGANLIPRLSKLRQRWWIAAIVALVLIALGTWAASRFREAPAQERALSLQITPPKGSEFTFGTQSAGLSLSPDGKTAAYIATDHGKAALWVRPLDSTTARLVPGTEDAGMPFWSPESKSIGFFAQGKLERVDLAGGTNPMDLRSGDQNGIPAESKSIGFFAQGKLERVDLAGGTPQTVCDIRARGGAWSDKGQILLGGWNSGLFQVAASGGKPSSLTTLDASRGELFHYWPQVLPGGRVLYFVRSNKREN